MTRGFITIATGKKHYYEIAANLLISYRHFSKNPLPFAIIANEENEYTKQFDDVIIIPNASGTFMDKFLLLNHCPYDETIFFDADSLAFGDLNEYWEFFANATDFSALGKQYDLSDNNGAWYNIKDVGRYGKLIKYKTRVHAGVLFIRKSDKLKKFYDDCVELYNNYDSILFHSFPGCKDECIFGLAMPMNGMRACPVKPEMIAFFPCLLKIKTDIIRGFLAYETPWHPYISNGIWLHWSTVQTYKYLYRFNVRCLRQMVSESSQTFAQKMLYNYRIALLPWKVQQLFWKLFARLKRLLR